MLVVAPPATINTNVIKLCKSEYPNMCSFTCLKDVFIFYMLKNVDAKMIHEWPFDRLPGEKNFLPG